MQAAAQGADELNAQDDAQHRDRIQHMALGTPGFPGDAKSSGTAGTWHWAKFFHLCLSAGADFQALRQQKAVGSNAQGGVVVKAAPAAALKGAK